MARLLNRVYYVLLTCLINAFRAVGSRGTIEGVVDGDLGRVVVGFFAGLGEVLLLLFSEPKLRLRSEDMVSLLCEESLVSGSFSKECVAPSRNKAGIICSFSVHMFLIVTFAPFRSLFTHSTHLFVYICTGLGVVFFIDIKLVLASGLTEGALRGVRSIVIRVDLVN